MTSPFENLSGPGNALVLAEMLDVTDRLVKDLIGACEKVAAKVATLEVPHP